MRTSRLKKAGLPQEGVRRQNRYDDWAWNETALMVIVKSDLKQSVEVDNCGISSCIGEFVEQPGAEGAARGCSAVHIYKALRALRFG
jgi:hypothetical protein